MFSFFSKPLERLIYQVKETAIGAKAYFFEEVSVVKVK
jgi:hypothetical protein